MTNTAEIRSIIVSYTNNKCILNKTDFDRVKDLILNKVSGNDKFTIMSIATMLYNHYNVKEDLKDKDNVCFCYCVTKPTACAELISRGFIKDMDDFFFNVRRYCIKLIKEEK